MADDDKAPAEAGTRAPRRQRDQATTGAPADTATGRPLPAPRTLTRTELETLRSRLQKKFH
jgi:hypothetical protein